MKILITGSQGQLGADCVRVFSKSSHFIAFDSGGLDIRNFSEVSDSIKMFRPDCVINCAAYTAVDKCESKSKTAFEINAKGPENLARAVEKYGGRLVHISTDYVFDGTKEKGEPYLESDLPGPISVYGKSKLAGENAVISLCANHVVVRTAWLFGISGQNFLKTMLLACLKDPDAQLKVVHDQSGSPTWSYTLAQQIKAIAKTEACGVFHAASHGSCSRFELARYFLEKMGVAHNLVPCTTDRYPKPAKRPANSVLKNSRLKKMGLDFMQHWKKDVEDFARQLSDETQGKVHEKI